MLPSLCGCFHAQVPVLSATSIIFPSSSLAFTRVTYPSSSSTFSSIKSKILSAPAKAIAIKLICCETCPRGFVKAFIYCKNAAILPIVRTCFTAKIPPITATNT